MKILIVDNYDSFTFNLTALVREAGFEPHVVKNDRLDFGKVETYGKILLSPGPGIPSESGRLCELIREFSARKSMLGICLGHQAIGEVFGARLAPLARPAHGIRCSVKILDPSESLFGGVPAEIEVGLYHSWMVAAEGFPQGLTVTASTPDGSVMALSHRDYDVRGVQFHPESIMTKWGRRMIDNWLSEVPLNKAP